MMTKTPPEKIRRPWVFLLSLLLCGQAVGQEIRWRELKSEAGGFTVLLPGEPQISEEPLQRGPLKLKRHIHALALANGVSLNVEYFDMPAGTRDAEMVREGGINGLTRSMIADGAKLLTRATVLRGSCEGLEATLELPVANPSKHGFVHGRIFSSGLRYYLMIFLSETEDSEAIRAMAQKFIESFTVIGGCTNAVPAVEAPASPPKVETLQGAIDAATGWRKIERRELGFSVLMPGAVRYESQEAQREPLPLTQHTFTYEDDDSVFSAEVIGDYPPKFYESKSSLDNLLDATIWGFRKNLEKEGFLLTPLRDLRVVESAGREFSLTHPQTGLTGRAQVYATPKRALVFSAIRQDKNLRSLDRFFTSILVSPK